jgi:hypothetical protein
LLTKSESCQERVSFTLERFCPLISTQVLGAMTGFSPSAFATNEITGEFCAQAEDNTKSAVAATVFIPRVPFAAAVNAAQSNRQTQYWEIILTAG